MGDDAGGRCVFGRNITWLLLTQIEYRYHIACVHLVISTRLYESWNCIFFHLQGFDFHVLIAEDWGYDRDSQP